MASAFTLDALTLSGFRAYLVPAPFDFSVKRSLAVFAPNGKGKSSLVDGIEFVLSDEGTLVRLGQRATDNQAGVLALPHNRAEEKGVSPNVSVRFKRGNEKPEGTRLATGTQRLRPKAASDVRACLVVDPIIRGHDLRRFVEEESAQQRYESVARWLDLGALVNVQRNLRDLRRQVKQDAEDERLLRAIGASLARLTANTLTSWDDANVLAYSNALLAALDANLTMASLDAGDPGCVSLKVRAEAESRRLGLEGLRQLRRSAAALVDPADASAGLVAQTEAAASALSTAAAKAEAERSAAANAMFEQVWRAAAPLFADGADAPDVCPVCTTPIAESPAGSREAIRDHVGAHRAELASYAEAKSALERATKAKEQAQQRLAGAVKSLLTLLPDDMAMKTSATAYLAAVEAWTGGPSPDAASFAADIAAGIAEIDQAVDAIETAQGEATYAKALTKIDALIALGADRKTALRQRAEFERILEALNTQSQFVAVEIRKKVQHVLDSLQTPLNRIYREIQRDAAVPVRLELPAEDDAAQHKLQLVVDFAQNRLGVQPGGYLSDSQIHSLALALRLAAIQRCNTGARFAVLDDIVTSYDADHRRAIAAMLGKEFADFQLIVTTHDDRFFVYLKELIGDAQWRFTRITHVDPEYGPRFSDNLVSDDAIIELWDKGHSASNEMRTAEEEWLLTICRDFGVDVRIRTVERAYSYERAELAAALASFLKSRSLAPPAVPGMNRFLSTLQQGVVENFGSHFQDAQYGAGSPGDEKVRWEEFTHFRSQFRCACGRSRFKRPHDLKIPVCQKCEAAFAFPVAKAA